LLLNIEEYVLSYIRYKK